MSRILAIDYGFKRTGIAVTDTNQIIANALQTIHTKDLLEFLKTYTEKEEVECIVFGMPTKDDGSDSDPVYQIKGAIKNCKKLFPKIKIDTQDESYTSIMAFDTMIRAGVKKQKRRDKALVDKISATIILQSYMQRIK